MMKNKKVLFIDRDGTLIVEPPIDFQVDDLSKLEFVPQVFTALHHIASELDFEIVMVSNQDGLGTKSFPEVDFQIVQEKVIKAFQNEGVVFQDIYIDGSLPEENSINRKPNVGMLSKYIYGNYDLENSYVIGDRDSDMKLALNIGAKGIFYNCYDNESAVLSTNSWMEIYQYLKAKPRVSKLNRVTSETDVQVELNLDGSGKSEIDTGIGFFDHMLEQIPRHANIDLKVLAKGDLHVDVHHTIEDVGIVLGRVFNVALSNKKGIERYGFLLPMDDSIAELAIDFGGRPFLNWNVSFNNSQIGNIPVDMFSHFFRSFCDKAEANLYVLAKGDNDHHIIEAVFKAFARAVKNAIVKNNSNQLPSTKGIL